MNILRLELHNQRKGLLIWSSIMFVSVFLFMAFFPSMGGGNMGELLTAETAAFSKEMLAAFGLDNMPDFSKIQEFFAYIMQYIALAGAIYAALRGATALIGEETSGTIEYLYAQPVRRSEIFFQKLLASGITFLSYSAAVTAAALVSLLCFKSKDTDLSSAAAGMVKIMIGMFFSGMVFLCIGFLLSTILKSSRLVASTANGLVFGTYILGIFAHAFENNIKGIQNLTYLSPLDYAMPSDILRNGFQLKFVILGFAVMAVSIGCAYLIYLKKDLKS
ncbi:MAG: ABC transporter permease subunit [Eubacteriales bacterium]